MNQIVINYSSGMMVNRALVVILVALILMVLYFRFTTTEEDNSSGNYLTLHLSTPTDTVQILPAVVERHSQKVEVVRPNVSIPAVALENKGARANLRKLVAATMVELTLLRHERSLIVLLPLSLLIAFLSLPFSIGAADVSTSAMFAGSSVRGLSLFLLGTIVFYVGEAMHRDREVRIDSVLWATPMHNNVLLLSKIFAVLLVSVLLMILAGFTAMLTQFLRGQTPIDVSSYVLIYTVILAPSLIFMAAASLALNVLLRDKYLCYAITIAIGSALFYLYSQGFNHWLYNPVLYGLWAETDFASSERLSYLTLLRLYWVGIAGICLVLAHAFFARKSK